MTCLDIQIDEPASSTTTIRFREFDRVTEEMLSERRARHISVDAYRRG